MFINLKQGEYMDKRVIKYWKYTIKVVRIFLISLGIITFVMCILSFTSLSFWTRYWLGTTEGRFTFKPDYIVMLGGSGMPSEDNLIRLYYTSELAQKDSTTKIIIVHPLDSMVYVKMKKELIDKKIDTSRIYFQHIGTNTRAQALGLAQTMTGILEANVVIVSSSEHILRAVQTFRKAGFQHVGAYPAMEMDMHVNLAFDVKKLGGKKYIPDIGNNVGARYNFWSYLKIEIICLREFTALFYYKLQGWI
jgi:uncharacterized SAM-binding protein YcdF (DUF218 family)